MNVSTFQEKKNDWKILLYPNYKCTKITPRSQSFSKADIYRCSHITGQGQLFSRFPSLSSVLYFHLYIRLSTTVLNSTTKAFRCVCKRTLKLVYVCQNIIFCAVYNNTYLLLRSSIIYIIYTHWFMRKLNVRLVNDSSIQITLAVMWNKLFNTISVASTDPQPSRRQEFAWPSSTE